MAERGPYIDPSYWEPPDDDDADDLFFEAFEDAVNEAADLDASGESHPLAGDGL